MIFRKLANGQYDDLNDLVEEDLLNRLKLYFDKLTDEQRSSLRFGADNILFGSFFDMEIREEDKRAHVRIDRALILLMGEEEVPITSLSLNDVDKLAKQ